MAPRMAMYLKKSRGKWSHITSHVIQNVEQSAAQWNGLYMLPRFRLTSQAEKNNSGTTTARLSVVIVSLADSNLSCAL